MKMPLHFADLGPSGLARRYGAVVVEDEASAPAQRLEAARKAVGEVVAKVGVSQKSVAKVSSVAKVTGRPSKHVGKPGKRRAASARQPGAPGPAPRAAAEAHRYCPSFTFDMVNTFHR